MVFGGTFPTFFTSRSLPLGSNFSQAASALSYVFFFAFITLEIITHIVMFGKKKCTYLMHILLSVLSFHLLDGQTKIKELGVLLSLI
jgi:hypothetical protein